ncbi:Protein of unknown function [Bacillus cereus]|jgi:predicted ester cyclase
MIG